MTIPVFVIHARSLPERVQHITSQLDHAGLSANWITDFDKHEITPEFDETWFTRDAPLSMAQKSCALKHITALQTIRDGGHELALILEDDAILCENFSARLQQTIDEAREWPRPFAISLGVATNWYPPASELKEGKTLYRGTRNRNAEAYVLGAQEAALRLAWIAEHKLYDAIDIAYNRADAAANITILWTDPPLAEQGSLTGKFHSSLDPKKRSAYVLLLQFAIQKFRRKYLKRWVHAGTEQIASRRFWRRADMDK